MPEFDFYFDLKFWGWLLLAAALYRLLRFHKPLRSLVLFLSSCFMLLALPRFDLNSLILLSTSSLITFSMGYLIREGGPVRVPWARVVLSSLSILSLVTFLSYFKYPFVRAIFSFFPVEEVRGAPSVVSFIGISYFTFKMIHFVVESHKRQIKDFKLLTFFNYIFFFPAFISGPISRYPQFKEEIRAEGGSLGPDLREGLERIIHGLFKKFVLCVALYPHSLIAPGKVVTELSFGEFSLALYAYFLYIYLDFSGYSDIAIGSARIMGIRLPENFNSPLMKKNLQQFWVNWHISLTSWLTDYIYWPLSKKYRSTSYFKKHPVTLSNVSIVATFAVCGLWHGDTFAFLLWGLYHGLGLTLLNIYQMIKRKFRNQRFRKFFLSNLHENLAWFITFNYVAFGLILFTLDMGTIGQLVKGLLVSHP